jgi:hypothetical protein
METAPRPKQTAARTPPRTPATETAAPSGPEGANGFGIGVGDSTSSGVSPNAAATTLSVNAVRPSQGTTRHRADSTRPSGKSRGSMIADP